MSPRLRFVLCLALLVGATALPWLTAPPRAADPIVGYSFVVYWPALMGAPFAFRGEGHQDLRQCNRIRALAVEKIEQFTGGPGKFTGTIGLCIAAGPTVVFPNE